MKIHTLVISLIFLGACTHNKSDKTGLESEEAQRSEYFMQAVLWYQHAPEVQALYYQGFNIAKQALLTNLANNENIGKKNAVVVDIDETILNNGLYQGWLITSNSSYSSNSWTQWVLDTIASPLPGAIDFLHFVEARNCEVFYVSNRSHSQHFKATLQNLQKYNLPFADEDHLLLKTSADTTADGHTSKEQRRTKIENNYAILLFIGDQLADFSLAFDRQSGSSASAISDSVFNYQSDFGKRFILMPNPMYCDWLNQIVYGDKSHALTTTQRDSLRYISLDRWKENPADE